MKVHHCWRCNQDLPFLDEREWSEIEPLLMDNIRFIKQHRAEHGSTSFASRRRSLRMTRVSANIEHFNQRNRYGEAVMLFRTSFQALAGGLMMLAVAGSALANEAPSIDQLVAAGATYSGTLQNTNGPDWAATATVQGQDVVHVKWSDNEETYRGKMGHGGGDPNAPIAMNATGADGSVVRFQWNSLDELVVAWWPDAAAQAGQKQHKPAHVTGTISRQ